MSTTITFVKQTHFIKLIKFLPYIAAFLSKKTVLTISLLCVFSFIFIHCNKKQLTTNDDLVQLGKVLFFDNRLSFNQTKACASCHDPKFAFTDGYKRSIGATGQLHQRNSKPLFNLSDNYYLTAADSSLHSIITQMNNPMFRTAPIELGLKGNEQQIIERLTNDVAIKEMFSKNFDKQKITILQIQTAIAAYLQTLKSYSSPYDAYTAGNKNALTIEEQNGMKLFFSEKFSCANCHGGKDFDNPILKSGNNEIDYYYNTGIYNIDQKGSYPITDQGLIENTKRKNDMGKYKVPTLRNLAFTAPYYHDGSTYKLMDVIEAYNNGGRQIKVGVNKGNGANNPYKHKLIKPLNMSPTEKNDLLKFLLCMSDSSFTKK